MKWKNTVHDVQDHLERGLNFSMFRRVGKLTMSSLKQQKSLFDKGTKYERDMTWRALDFKPFRDRLDGDLIWSAVLGFPINKTLTPMHCFTCDPVDPIKLRVTTLRALIVSCQQMIEVEKADERTRETFKGIEPTFGNIHCLEARTLKLVETIDVARFLRLPE